MEAKCYVCQRMRERKPELHANLTTEGVLQTCLLCNKDFCPKHGGHTESVCEANHATYYRKHSDRPGVYPNMAARENALAAKEGSVYPWNFQEALI